MNIRTLLVGFGEMGRRYHLPALIKAAPVIQVVGIVRLKDGKISELPNTPIYLDYEKALHELKPNFVVISTPHVLHASQIRLALKYNCHVYVEKPIALEYKDTMELVSYAEKQQLLLVVGLQRRHEGFFSIVRELKSENRLGRIIHAHGLFAHTFDNLEPTGWRCNSQLSGDGVLDDSAFHILDVLLAVAGTDINHMTACNVHCSSKGLPQSFSAIFQMDTGAIVNATCGYISPRKSVQEEISFFGEDGSVFARRFCLEWNSNPPHVSYKSRDGAISREYDLRELPFGRSLPLEATLSVLLGNQPRNILLTEGKDLLITHRAVSLIKQAFRHPSPNLYFK